MSSRVNYSFRWNADGITQQVDKAMAAGLKDAGLHAKKVMKAKLGGAPNSPAGGPPGKVSGTLQKAVAAQAFSKKNRYVGVEVGIPKKSSWDSKAPGGGKKFPGRMRAQGVRLARGYSGRDRAGRTYNQAPRPFAVPVLMSEKSRMATLLQDGARRFMPKPKEKR